MRAHGSCPRHPGQPYYHCPECASERQRSVGESIADEVHAERPVISGGDRALVADPLPVRITPRAAEHLMAALNDFRRNRIESQIQTLRERASRIPESDPEGVITRNHLARLEASADGADVEGFDVMVQVFLDVTGASGVHPKVELCEPSKIPNFGRDYRVYQYSGGLKVAVELRQMNYLRGLIVDWHDRLDRSGFVIRHVKGDWSSADR